jgi:hypothetical protein
MALRCSGVWFPALTVACLRTCSVSRYSTPFVAGDDTAGGRDIFDWTDVMADKILMPITVQING